MRSVATRIRSVLAVSMLLVAARTAAASPTILLEKEPNNSSATATSLGGAAVVFRGNLRASDTDWFSFQATAGSRLYATIMDAAATGPSRDVSLSLVWTDGASVLEKDDNDGYLGLNSPSIAGSPLPADGTYYLKVQNSIGSGQVRPYFLYVRVQSGSPVPEVEPNDGSSTAGALPPGGWVSGHRDAADQDWFSIPLQAGDTVFVSLDVNPERDSDQWDGRLGFGFFGDGGDAMLWVDDTDLPGLSNPLSEALLATVENAGTYYVAVASAPDASGTYQLSVSVLPAATEAPTCTTFTSSDVPRTIPDAGSVLSSLVVPAHPRIADIDVALRIDHAEMADLDVRLRSPAGNDNGLFQDVGATISGGQSQMDLVLDDEAAFPIGSFDTMKGLAAQPDPAHLLSWFDGEDAGGTWTLDVRDDTANGLGGTLLGWSLRICEPAPVCSNPAPLFSTGFEAGDGGFTHAGPHDEWTRGFPVGASAPILGCAAGNACFKTDRTGGYDASSSQDLISPPIDLAALEGNVVLLSWAQAYQMEDATFDHAYVEVREVSGANPRKVFEWGGGTMRDSAGIAATPIDESAGWSVQTADVSDYIGRTVQVRFHLDSDAAGNYSGFAIDDVAVSSCCSTDCDDQNSCTADQCGSGGLCVHTAIADGTPCDDISVCTQTETCTDGICNGAPVSCEDQDPCTDDGCHAVSGCFHVPTTSCDDGIACTVDSCSSASGCMHTPDASRCIDGSTCTTDQCDPFVGCTHTGDPYTCDDGNFCTDDDCLAGGGCSHTPNNSHSCDDGNPCTDGDWCDDGVCAGSPTHCITFAPCSMNGTCDPAVGHCVYPPRVCDDGNPCTYDYCEPLHGCAFTLPDPGEVPNLRAIDGSSWTWGVPDPIGPHPRYDLARGLVSELPVGSGTSEVCVAAGTPNTMATDAATPPAGQSFWYLVRGEGDSCACLSGSGCSYGTGTYDFRFTRVCP